MRRWPARWRRVASRSRGGRASEFLLGCAIALQGESGVWALAADTDGIDDTEDNAGAFGCVFSDFSYPWPDSQMPATRRELA